MKVVVYVSTGYVGSRREEELEIDDEDLEGLSENERDAEIDRQAQDVLWDMISWGWDVKE